jgi:hypothetical protein
MESPRNSDRDQERQAATEVRLLENTFARPVERRGYSIAARTFLAPCAAGRARRARGSTRAMSDPGRRDLPPDVPHPPYDELRAALGDDTEAAASVDALRDQLHSGEPDPATVEHHAGLLRGIPVLEARIANWWDDPDTQRWIKAITDAGL